MLQIKPESLNLRVTKSKSVINTVISDNLKCFLFVLDLQ